MKHSSYGMSKLRCDDDSTVLLSSNTFSLVNGGPRNHIENAVRGTKRKGTLNPGPLKLFVDARERTSCRELFDRDEIV